MPFIHPNPDSLEGHALIGTAECVALLQNTMSVPHTSLWREGAVVFGNPNIQKGTAIATFVNGRYPLKGRKHAAIYISQDEDSIYVIDQWRDREAVGIRPIRVKPTNKDGSHYDPSNNAKAFSVIETQDNLGPQPRP
ncbi:MAG: BPSL0067 family protein [Neisseriaceae bacterium]|nr:BPSL0067 family protein [Neisseriaceae bacterium]